MRPTAALAALRDYVTAAAVLPGGCHYPPQPAPAPRSGQLRLASFELPDGLGPPPQVWLLRPALYLVAPKLNESTYDTAALDPLVAAVVDVFDPANAAAFHLETATGRAEYAAVVGGAVEPFAGWYAVRLDFLVKLIRFAGSA